MCFPVSGTYDSNHRYLLLNKRKISWFCCCFSVFHQPSLPRWGSCGAALFSHHLPSAWPGTEGIGQEALVVLHCLLPRAWLSGVPLSPVFLQRNRPSWRLHNKFCLGRAPCCIGRNGSSLSTSPST